MGTQAAPIQNPDITGLIAYPGDFKMQLLSKLYEAFKLESQGVLVIGGMKYKLNLHKMLVKKGLKPFTGTFSSKPDISFEPRTLEVEKVQRDLEIFPDRYRQTFAGYLRGQGENVNNMTIPFAQFMWEKVMEENANELVTETVYNGVGKAGFAAFAPGTAYTVGALVKYTQDNELRYFRAIASTTAGQTPDTNPEKWEWAGARAITRGFNSYFQEEVANGKIVPVSTGPITSTDAYEQFTTMWRSQLEVVRNNITGGNIYCSQTSYDALSDAYETQTRNFQQINGVTVLPKTDGKCRIRPVNWLSGTNRLICTMDNNLVMGTDSTSDQNIIKVIEKMYHLEFGMSFMIGFNIMDVDVIRLNDQA